MEVRGRRWQPAIAGLIAIGVLVAPASNARAQQQSGNKPVVTSARRYEPASLRGIRTFIGAASRGPAGPTLFPTLPPSSETLAVTDLAPAPAGAAAPPNPDPPAVASQPPGSGPPRLVLTSSPAVSSSPVGEAASPARDPGPPRREPAPVRAWEAPTSVAMTPQRNGAIVVPVGSNGRGSAIATPVNWRGRRSATTSVAVGPASRGSGIRTRIGRSTPQAPRSDIVLNSTAPAAAAETSASGPAVIQTAPYRPPNYRAVVSSGGYRLGAGDTIDVFVWRNPELSRQVPVRPDGRISLPLAGELVAEGKTAGELQDEITAILGDFVQVPTVTVTVTEIKSLVIYVLGNVAKPGPIELDRNVDVLQAIAMASGLTEFADKNGITIMRTVNGVEQRIAFPYGDVVKGKVAAPRLTLRAGDVIYVP